MAKKITEESLRLNIIVNGDQGRKAILDMENAVKSNNATLAKLKTDLASMEAQGKTTGKAYDSLKKQIEKETVALESNRQKLEALKRQQSVNTMTMAELRKHIALTRTALVNAVPDTENWKRLNSELQESKTRLKQLETQSQATDKTVCGLAGRFRDYYISVKGGFDIAKQVWRYVTQATDAYQEYDEAITDAMKTTNLSKEEVAALGEEFKKMDTRTAQNELMALLRIGGKLGISGQEDLLGFVRAADKINVALSEDLGGNAEDAIAAIGKMTDIFDLASVYGQEEAMLKIASAVNSLGMASTANEGYIVDFTKRMAGIAPNADISIDKILGLAATLDKYGQTSEFSSTAIGQTIVAMYKKTETFANIARMSFGEFKQLLDIDVNEALLRVAEGMKGAADGGFAPIVEAMDGMGLNGQRAVTVLGTLAKNSEEVRSQQALANQAFSDGSSVIDEFNTKNESATAKMEKAKNSIHNQVVEIGQQLMPVVQGVMDIADVGMGVLAKLVGFLAQHKIMVIALAVAYGALGAAQKIANINFKALITSVKMFGKALMANPIGLIVGAIGALAGGLVTLVSRSRESTKALRELNEQTVKTTDGYTEAVSKINAERKALDELKSAVLNANIGSGERARAIKAINDRYAEYLPNLLTEKSSNNEVETALKGVNDEMERRILLQAKEQELVKVQQHRTDAIKAIITDANTLSEQKRGRKLSASEIKRLTEEAVKYYDTRLSGGDEYFMDALPGLSSALGMTGGSAKRVEKIREEFDKAIQSGHELQIVVDELFKNPGTSGGSGTGSTTTTTTTTTTGTGDSAVTGSGSKWSLNNDEAYLEAALALKKKYAAGEIETEKELNTQILQLEIDTLKKRLEIAEGDEILSVDSQLQDKLIQQKNARIRAEEEAARKAVKTESQLQLEQLNERESRAKAAHELAMLQLQNRHNEEIAAAKANGDDLTALAERQAKERADKELLYINELQTILKDLTGDKHTITLDLGNADADVVALQTKVEELLALIAKLNGSESVNYSGGSSQGGSSQNQDGEKKPEYKGMNFLGVNSDDWMSLVEAMKNGTMSANEWATAIQGIGGAAEYAMGLASKWADNQTKLENEQLKKYEKANDKKKKTLEKRLDAGLISESVYNAEIERMDEEMEKKQEELALKQAKRQKAMSLLQAIINTAMSVTMALCSVAPPASYVFAALNAAMGAAEIALIASQPITTGYADGGQVEVKRAQDGKVFKARLSPDRGLVTAPTALVGEDGAEYVIPNDGLRNPSLVPILASIESARRNGTLRSLDFGAVYSPVAATALGYSEGGFVASGSSAATMQSQSLAGNREVTTLLREIARKLDNPVPAQVTMLGKNGIVKKMEEYNRYKNRGRL